MASLQELRQRALGLQSATENRQTDMEAARAQDPAAPTSAFQALRDRALQVDREFDTVTGVPHAKFRAGFSFMDTDEEREKYLSDAVGKDGWKKDAYGNWGLTPKGMEALGFQHEGKPVLIEERGITSRDLADIAGSLPSIAGGIAGGTAGAATGVPAVAVGLAGLGTAAGKSISEMIEQAMGLNLQPGKEVARDVRNEALLGMAGEGVGQLAGKLGRKLMAPEAKRMTPERSQLKDEALAMGARPRAGQVTGAPILSRVESMMNMIFKDPLIDQNQKALTKEMARLQSAAGPRVTKGKVDLGNNIKTAVSSARKSLSDWSRSTVRMIERQLIPEDKPAVIPTARLKAEAKAILEDLPKTRAVPETVDEATMQVVPGQAARPVLTDGHTIRAVTDIQSLPDNITLPQMQAVTNNLYEAISDEGLVPGISGSRARRLWKAGTSSYDDIADPELRAALTEFRTEYAKQIEKFDNALVARIMRDPSKAGALDPEDVLGAVFRKGKATAIRRLREVAGPAGFADLRGRAMSDLLEGAIKRTDDPFESLLDGKSFLGTLDRYGRETLTEMFGKDLTDQLYRFGRVTQLVTKESGKSGAIVAASIALHPVRNILKLVQLRTAQKFMLSENGLKWLTDGLEAPKTRAGADALTRVATMASMLADEETGGPTFGGGE